MPCHHCWRWRKIISFCWLKSAPLHFARGAGEVSPLIADDPEFAFGCAAVTGLRTGTAHQTHRMPVAF